jgi:arsenate reductase (glutaredoxin)
MWTAGSLRAMASTPESMRVYHNPVCSKSRGALEILEERGADVDVIEYLKARPTRADLERILASIPDEPAALVRKDKRFKELELDAADYQSSDEVVALLLEHPELMERPVVFRGDRALICRPSERVLELLD